MKTFQYILLGLLVICAISVSFSRKLLNSIMIFMSYSLVMSIIWICLESPDLAITEAAVGAGVTSVLFFITLKKIHAIKAASHSDDSEEEVYHELAGRLIDQGTQLSVPPEETEKSEESVPAGGAAAPERRHS